ncbi:hypothetical protein GC093_19150 [Paenibacillus sp. LMG 31456]|uniref:Uncharacterized protein n=1 Tax=Paenibacillus foliorum TaxID=2654974 RepID=A0A972H308_9BACL|nr:hypothetical protein [Paenibacillus foliorum]NOU95326.1 hypothetical protein [Paenibacillus foliorum]
MKTIKRIPLLYPIFLTTQLVKYTGIIVFLIVCSLPKGAYHLTRYALGYWRCDCCNKTYWANHEYSLSGHSDHKNCRNCYNPKYLD